MDTDSRDGDDERSSTGIWPSTTGDGSHASRWTEWLLVDGGRIAIAGAVAVLVFCFLVGAEALGLLYAASALVAVAAFPAALLVTYTLRTATVTRRTVTIGPFLAGSDPDAKPFGGAAASDD